MKVKGLSAIFLTTTLLVAPWASHADMLQPLLAANGLGVGADDASLYADGTRAINESRWSDAAGLFDRVAQMHGEHAEGALYWKAYAENKGGQPANALSTCGELRKAYPKLKINLVPVGQVLWGLNQWMKLGKVPGYSDVHQLYKDNIHLNDGGSFAVGCVLAGGSEAGKLSSSSSPSFRSL